MQFLHDDPEMSKALGEDKILDSKYLSRNKRQVEETGVNFESQDEGEEKGILTRAADFMMEVLQRFLKWVNNTE